MSPRTKTTHQTSLNWANCSNNSLWRAPFKSLTFLDFSYEHIIIGISSHDTHGFDIKIKSKAHIHRLSVLQKLDLPRFSGSVIPVYANQTLYLCWPWCKSIVDRLLFVYTLVFVSSCCQSIRWRQSAIIILRNDRELKQHVQRVLTVSWFPS